jgi:hypothetical protein
MPKDMLHLIEALAGEIYGELIALAGLRETVMARALLIFLPVGSMSLN